MDLTEDCSISPEYRSKYCDGKAWPLPRYGSSFVPEENQYEVVVAGAGPAGMFLTLLLARYGLDGQSVLCVDSKARTTDVGHADGVSPRMLEILATLGLEYEITKYGRRWRRTNYWMRKADGSLEKIDRPGLRLPPTEYPVITLLPQSRIEKMFENDLKRYAESGIAWNSTIVSASMNETNTDFPIAVRIRSPDGERVVYTKYLVGADGAHSQVRRSFGIELDGDTTDSIYGVIDACFDSDFPDIRCPVNFTDHTSTHLTHGVLVPREKLSNGAILCRFVINMSETRTTPVIIGQEQSEEIRRKKAAVKKDHILDQVAKCVAPYTVSIRKGTQPIWWASYSVGQRLAKRFVLEDSYGMPRVFLAGDAAHTHTPRQGQGMNISMMDAYWLGWRLAYSVLGLTPHPKELLRTYESERRPWAHRIVTSDIRWNQKGVSPEVFREEARDQVTAIGVEEKPSIVVSDKNDSVSLKDRDLASGVLRTGRRLLDVTVTRFADREPQHKIYEDLPSDGKYRILLLAAKDFPAGKSKQAIEDVCALVVKFGDLLEQVVLCPCSVHDFGWTDLPSMLKYQAEMRVHLASQEVYDIYGVEPASGAIILLRPDGIVAITAALDDMESIAEMLQRVLKASPV